MTVSGALFKRKRTSNFQCYLIDCLTILDYSTFAIVALFDNTPFAFENTPISNIIDFLNSSKFLTTWACSQ